MRSRLYKAYAFSTYLLRDHNKTMIMVVVIAAAAATHEVMPIRK